MKSLHLDSFKRRYGITQAKLNEFRRRGVVRVVQSGYKGHSLCHPREVEFEPEVVRKALAPVVKIREYNFWCLGYHNQTRVVKRCNLAFKSKAELTEHQRQARHNSWDAADDRFVHRERDVTPPRSTAAVERRSWSSSWSRYSPSWMGDAKASGYHNEVAYYKVKFAKQGKRFLED